MPAQHNIPDGFDARGKAVGRAERRLMAGWRIDSVDALRGLTILLMLYVNDLGPAAPAFLHHIQPPNADGTTLADIVFPAFLFLVGVSSPLAFERTRAAGPSKRTHFGNLLSFSKAWQSSSKRETDSAGVGLCRNHWTRETSERQPMRRECTSHALAGLVDELIHVDEADPSGSFCHHPFRTLANAPGQIRLERRPFEKVSLGSFLV